MRTDARRFAALAGTALLCAWTLHAQDAAPISAEEEAEWVKIRAIKPLYEEAVSTNQLESLRPYVAKNFHAIVINGSEARSFDELLQRNKELRDLMGAGGKYTVKVKYQPGTMFGNLAVAHGTADESVTTGSGKRFDYTSSWLVNLVKEDGQWKLYRLQASLDPINNTFVQDTVKYTRLFFGVGALLLGIALGYGLRALRR